jgi:hypothetical protein
MVTDMTEPEFYFPGELVLAFVIERGDDVEHKLPLPGLYLYLSEAEGPSRIS